MADLSQARVLMLATDGFEQSELFEPRKALMEAGAQVTLASLETRPITAARWPLTRTGVPDGAARG